MQIQVHTDNHITGSAGLTQHVQTEVESKLQRFSTRITRVEVHLADDNSSQKSADNDKRCVIEARLNGLQPISVTDRGESIDQALYGAIDKLRAALDRAIGKLSDRKGDVSFSGE